MRAIYFSAGLFMLVIGWGASAFAGKTELTTFYPSAYGEYQDLSVGSGSFTYPTTPAGNYGAITLKGSSILRMVMNDGQGNFQQYLNSYYDSNSGTSKYATGSQACRFNMSAGTFSFFVAPSGTAGADITWTTGLFINNSGNVAIGTTAPTTKFGIFGASSATQVYNTDPVLLLSKSSGTRVADEGVSLGFNSTTSFLYGAIKGAATNSAAEFGGYLSFFTTTSASSHYERMRIDQDGNVGIGTTAPLGKLSVAHSFDSASARTNSIYLTDPNNTNMKGYIGLNRNTGAGVDKEYLSIEAVEEGVHWMNIELAAEGGNVGIGITVPTYKFQVNGQPAANGYTAFTNYSDIRLKENIRQLDGGMLGKIMELRPLSFQYNNKYYQETGYSRDVDHSELYGFSAQDMKKVFPEMVREKKLASGSYLETNLSNLQVYLVKAIQEQQAEIESLKKEIKELKKK